MLKIIYANADQAVAQRIMRGLEQDTNNPVDDMLLPEASQKRGDILLLVLSPSAWADKSVKNVTYQALDNMQHVIPIYAQVTKLPHVVDHLDAVDFSKGDDFAELNARIAFLSSPDAPPPIKVLTPSLRRSNWRVGAIFILLIVSMFCVGILAIGGGVSRPPEAEYNAVETAIQGTIAVEIAQELNQYVLFLPQGTDEAANYASTLQRHRSHPR
jgi:hypothetical protein